MTLFDPGPAAPPPEEMGEDAKRTARRRSLLRAGIHPTTRRPLRPEGGTCGDCAHLLVNRGNCRRFWKCGRVPLVTRGAATDVRLSWPACVLWEPAK